MRTNVAVVAWGADAAGRVEASAAANAGMTRPRVGHGRSGDRPASVGPDMADMVDRGAGDNAAVARDAPRGNWRAADADRAPATAATTCRDREAFDRAGSASRAASAAPPVEDGSWCWRFLWALALAGRRPPPARRSTAVLMS